jgi:outer membrane protein OmpA-like peptidoglycan-associated protein
MSATRASSTVRLLALCLMLAAPTGIAAAAEPQSAEQIIQALKPGSGIRRGLATAPAAKPLTPEQVRFLDSLRDRKTRSLTSEDREQIATIAKTRPSIDLEINFDYDSAAIGSKALGQVSALGQALTSGELKGRTFVVAGHTDAKGSESYNQSLSEQRAAAVQRFLSERYGIDAGNLVTVGHGKTQLKNAADPFAAENRRVQVINLGGE